MPNPVQVACTTGQRMLLQATAAGHTTREREISCDRDETLELALDANAPGGHGWHSSSAKPAAKSAVGPGEVNPNGGQKIVRPIETASPYQ
jgi:hypothetical protein